MMKIKRDKELCSEHGPGKRKRENKVKPIERGLGG